MFRFLTDIPWYWLILENAFKKQIYIQYNKDHQVKWGNNIDMRWHQFSRCQNILRGLCPFSIHGLVMSQQMRDVYVLIRLLSLAQNLLRHSWQTGPSEPFRAMASAFNLLMIKETFGYLSILTSLFHQCRSIALPGVRASAATYQRSRYFKD